MKVIEQMALNYYENHVSEIKTIIINAFTEGYSQGLKKAREITMDHVNFYDLGLPSGTLWSKPICVKHPYTYVTYELSCYSDVCDLPIPTLEDLQELIHNCRVDRDGANIAKDVVVIGPSGRRIGVGTEDYRNNPSNPHSVKCCRKGEGVKECENMFWINVPS